MEFVADVLGRRLNEPRTEKFGTQRPGSPRAAGLQRKPLDRLQSVDSTSFLVGRRDSCAGLLPARLEQAILDLYIYMWYRTNATMEHNVHRDRPLVTGRAVAGVAHPLRAW